MAAIPLSNVSGDFQSYYERYLAQGFHADLKYLEAKTRFDLQSIYPHARTLILFTYPYRFESTESKLKQAPYKVARYAWQRDYHILLKEKLNDLLQQFSLKGRAVTDSAPLLERYWARRAGLGLIGKNGMLIDRARGSYFLIAALLIEETCDEYAAENVTRHVFDMSDICVDCTRCIDACPTSALLGDGVLDAGKCISYQTIERKNAATYDSKAKRHSWIFGCDICQQVCPYNQTKGSYADGKFNDEHEAAISIATGCTPQTRELKNSVFARRGIKKIVGNRAALDAVP